MLQESILSFLLFITVATAISLYCTSMLEYVETSNPNWTQLANCIREVGSETFNKNQSETIWLQTKKIFNSIEGIPSNVYKELGFVLAAIPENDLQNISMDTVEIVAAFGYVSRYSAKLNVSATVVPLLTFSAEQMQLIATKIRNEWRGKNPLTYSEYDLRFMDALVCRLNEEDITALQGKALTAAMAYIGRIEVCPQAHALFRRLKEYDAFGAPAKWSKLEISWLGHLISVLSTADEEEFGMERLNVNRYYVSKLLNETTRTTTKEQQQKSKFKTNKQESSN